MKETDLAYIAGIIDGEGYVGIKRSAAYKCQGRKTPGFHARIQVRMVDESAIRFLADRLGGWYYKEKPHCNNGRPLFCYQVSDRAAEKIIRQLLPHLKVKHKQAEIVLSLRELQSNMQEHKTKVVGRKNFPNKYGTRRMVKVTALSDEYVERCQKLWMNCRLLNGLARTVA